MDQYKKILFLLFLFMSFSNLTFSQNDISVSLLINDYDEINGELCFEIRITNRHTQEIKLSGQNWRFFYNSGEMSLLTDSLISYLPIPQYSSPVIVQLQEGGDGTGLGDLQFESNLGFVNFFIDLLEVENGGIIIPVGQGLSIGKLCFQTTFATDVYCPEIVFADIDITGPYAFISVEVSEWIDANNQTGLNIVEYTDGGPDDTDDYCIYFVEDSFIPCQDLIDNDDDQMIDCEDLDCARPDILSIDTVAASCPELVDGVISINAQGENMVFSIDGGINFQTEPQFDSIVPNSYEVIVLNEHTGCTDSIFLEILPRDCFEICGDGIDNDGNGLIDCDDEACNVPTIQNIDFVNPTCSLSMDGSLSFEAEGFNLKYQVLFIGQFITNLNMLDTGTYHIIVTDSISMCFDSTSVILTALDCQENCYDGVDNNDNGLIDCDDPECGIPVLDSIEFQPPSCFQNRDGSIIIHTATNNLIYSIDGGINFTDNPSFLDLDTGNYEIIVVNNLSLCSDSEFILLTSETCMEDCFDGEDNDGDELIDADDPDCIEQPLFSVPNAINGSSQFSINSSYRFMVDRNLIERINYFQVYDRWGNKVYFTSDIDVLALPYNVWTPNTKNLTPGVYIVVINYTLKNGNKSVYYHDITII